MKNKPKPIKVVTTSGFDEHGKLVFQETVPAGLKEDEFGKYILTDDGNKCYFEYFPKGKKSQN